MRNNTKVVIYDCDGVMFDSFEANLAFYNRIMTELDRQPLDRSDQEQMRVLHTYANRDVLAHFFPEPSDFSAAVRAAGAIDYRDLIGYMQMENGFREVVEVLVTRVQLAVCTNRSTSMDLVLASFDLSRFFSFVMTAAKVSNPKPHPEPLLKILAHYGIAAGEALFVGDSVLDSQAAAAAGVPFVAYRNDLPGFARIDDHLAILPLV